METLTGFSIGVILGLFGVSVTFVTYWILETLFGEV